MKKRIVVYIILGLITILVVYIYTGMYLAKNETNLHLEVEGGNTNSQNQNLKERLKDAGAMSEESRQEMLDRLKDA